MAKLLDKGRRFFETVPGRVLLACVYAVMLVLILIYFTGNGQFIYEAF